MKIETATIDDTEELLALQKAAFHKEAVFYNNFTITPLIETIGEYRDAFSTFVVLKASDGSRIVGSVRANTVEHTCFITRLVVHPAFQRRGIGIRLMDEIEKRTGEEITRFELFTGGKSTGNIALYEKCGYLIIRRTEGDGVPMVIMEKRREG